MQHETDRLPYSIMMMNDITARKATDQKLRMFVHTITSMNECVVITDSQGRILSVNPAFLSTYGYEPEEIIGRNVRELVSSPASGETAAVPFPDPEKHGWTGELRHARKNGETFPVLLSTSVVRDDTGEPIALVGISRDITEQQRLEEQLHATERERSADLRQFAISVQRAQEEERLRISRELHDDLCQRLSGMKFRVEALEGEVTPEVSRGLGYFTQELDRAITEVRRISSNLRPSALDDFGLVIALRMLCKDFEKRNNIRATFHLGDSDFTGVNPQIEIALYRIAQEALSNTARHANATCVALHLLMDGAFLRLIVEDDGMGFQWEEVTRERGPGHGLGLINMRERTELLGGRFEVDSATNQGSTIAVSIPIGEEESHEKDQTAYR
jgi:PAS domain S-box-containing protein